MIVVKISFSCSESGSGSESKDRSCWYFVFGSFVYRVFHMGFIAWIGCLIPTVFPFLISCMNEYKSVF